MRTASMILLLGVAISHAGKPPVPNQKEELLVLDNGSVKVGIDRYKGASITYLSWAGYPKNMVNGYDPGRLIQQSYYSGRMLDRRSEGQHKAWSPWSWNPIQGGGVGSWARVTGFRRPDKGTLFGETVPKLWDMADEEAEALMRQWVRFEPEMPNTVVVNCEFIAKRKSDDRWGPARRGSPQEIPATYISLLAGHRHRVPDRRTAGISLGKIQRRSRPAHQPVVGFGILPNPVSRLDTLDHLKLTDNTIIIFFSDNGGNMYNTVDGTTPTSNAPLRGGKASMFEGAVRVPMIVAWPGRVRPDTRNDSRVQSDDFYPTLPKRASGRSEIKK